jgi:hypothetical protein
MIKIQIKKTHEKYFFKNRNISHGSLCFLAISQGRIVRNIHYKLVLIMTTFVIFATLIVIWVYYNEMIK